MVDELAGKVAIVTGGASGIGRGTVERFVAEGARVVIADIERDRGEALAASLGADALFRRADVSDPEQVGALVGTAVEKFGGLHVMVNNAGVSSTVHRRFLDDDLADFHRVMSVNVLGVMAGTRDAARHMASHGGGSIINMSSVVSSVKGVVNRFAYGASKAGVIGLTKAVAADFVTRGIRCNVICPGTVDTPSLHERLRSTGDYDAALRSFVARQPMGRTGKPSEIAALALYLASDESTFTTGQPFIIDGGWSN